MSAVHVGPRNARRARAAKKKEEDYADDEDVDEILYEKDYEDIDSEIEEDDEEFDAYAEQLAEEGIILVKEKKKVTVPRVPRQPKPVELDAEGNPVPKKPKQPKQPKKEKAPLTEEQLEKQRQRQQREASPQFISGHEFDKYLREEGALEEDEEPAEMLKPRINRVRGAGILNRTTVEEPVFDVAPVEWDPNAPPGAAGALPTAKPAPMYHTQQQWSDEDYHEDDDDDEEYLGEGRRKKRTGTGGSGRRIRTSRSTKSVAPVPQPTRTSSRSAAVGRKRTKYDDDTEDDEDFDEDYGSDMTDSPRARRRRSGGGGGGGTKKRGKMTGGYTAPIAAAGGAYRSAPRGGSVGLVAGAKALGAVFVHILDLMKKEGEAHKKAAGKNALTYFSIFGDPVSLASVPDYRTKVREDKSMWLKKIRSKAVKGEYYDVESAMKDFRQIRENAKAYNDPLTGGKFAFPGCIEYAEGIVGYVEEKLQWPENEHAVNLALEQIAAARSGGGGDGGGYYEDYGQGGGGVEDFVVAFDPSANYSLEALPPADPTTAQPVAEDEWVLCENCKAWRILEPGINPEDSFYCSMKEGFSCETPLEPGGSYEEG